MTSKTFEATYSERFEGEYNIFLPDGQMGEKQVYPLLVYLHGYTSEYIPPAIMEDKIPDGLVEMCREFDFILACPLCPFGFYWRTTQVVSFIDHVTETYSVDKKKVCLSGTSMGGFGTWATAHEFPDKFAGIAPVAGGVYEISQYQAHRLKTLPVWAFHNRGDEIIKV